MSKTTWRRSGLAFQQSNEDVPSCLPVKDVPLPLGCSTSIPKSLQRLLWFYSCGNGRVWKAMVQSPSSNQMPQWDPSNLMKAKQSIKLYSLMVPSSLHITRSP